MAQENATGQSALDLVLGGNIGEYLVALNRERSSEFGFNVFQEYLRRMFEVASTAARTLEIYADVKPYVFVYLPTIHFTAYGKHGVLSLIYALDPVMIVVPREQPTIAFSVVTDVKEGWGDVETDVSDRITELLDTSNSLVRDGNGKYRIEFARNIATRVLSSGKKAVYAQANVSIWSIEDLTEVVLDPGIGLKFVVASTLLSGHVKVTGLGDEEWARLGPVIMVVKEFPLRELTPFNASTSIKVGLASICSIAERNIVVLYRVLAPGISIVNVARYPRPGAPNVCEKKPSYEVSIDELENRVERPLAVEFLELGQATS